MFKRDEEGSFIGAIIGLVILGYLIYIIVYVFTLIATVAVSVATTGGTIFGGCSAIKNYILSFKENVIDSNKPSTRAV